MKFTKLKKPGALTALPQARLITIIMLYSDIPILYDAILWLFCYHFPIPFVSFWLVAGSDFRPDFVIVGVFLLGCLTFTQFTPILCLLKHPYERYAFEHPYE